ncbi:MAG: hypothetical protein AB7E80_09980 [Hyphomicrobiaceae bacterium]
MAQIVDFRIHAETRATRRVRHRGLGSAEIVIFPGVRYERWEEPAAAKRRGRPRDRIDLPD